MGILQEKCVYDVFIMQRKWVSGEHDFTIMRETIIRAMIRIQKRWVMKNKWTLKKGLKCLNSLKLNKNKYCYSAIQLCNAIKGKFPQALKPWAGGELIFKKCLQSTSEIMCIKQK